MNFKISKHALEQINLRNISEDTINEVISNYDKILNYDECLKVFQKILKIEKKQYLFRVFVNICKEPALIVTAYKTTKIKKYENKI